VGIFAGTAAYYRRFRPPYPEALVANIVAVAGSGGRGRLLDLGCGTGQLAVPLSRHFRDVVAVDAEEEMVLDGHEGRGDGDAQDARRHDEGVHPVVGRARLGHQHLAAQAGEADDVLARHHQDQRDRGRDAQPGRQVRGTAGQHDAAQPGPGPHAEGAGGVLGHRVDVGHAVHRLEHQRERGPEHRQRDLERRAGPVHQHQDGDERHRRDGAQDVDGEPGQQPPQQAGSP
jgi:SAM-dependent methyltransferase